LAIQALPYTFLRERKFILNFIENAQIPFPWTMDQNHQLISALGTSSFPQLIILSEGKKHAEYSDQNWLAETELCIQKLLRTNDPGLPLLSPFQPTNFFPQDKFRIELGLKPAFGTTYENSGIHPFVISGEFIHDDEKITIKDSNTQLQFLNPCPHLSIVAGSGTTRSGSKSIDPATLAVDVGDVPAYEGIMGEHLSPLPNPNSITFSSTFPKTKEKSPCDFLMRTQLL
jgi:hypothetical protein